MAFGLGKFFSSGGGNIFQKGEERVVGIDLGHSSVKAVQLRKEKGKVILETYGEIALGPYGGLAVGQVANLDQAKLAQLVKDLFTEANVTTAQVSFSIPLRSSLLVILDLPDVGKSKLEKIVPIEARKYVPVPISEVELDWWVIPSAAADHSVAEGDTADNEGGKGRVEVLLAAIHKDVLTQYQEVAKLASLTPKFFEIETFSAIRSVFGGELSPTAIIDLGAATSKLSIVDYGVVRLSHTISKGSQDITISISRSLGIDFARAEEIKRQVGLVERADGPDVGRVINTILEYIFAEVNKVMSIYQQKHRRSISKIVLIGSGSLMVGLLDLAKRSFEVPVTIGTPFDKSEYPAFLENVLKNTGPGFAVAMGLALRQLEELN